MKNILSIHRPPEGHWVGDGFPVRTVLDYGRHPELTPFLLLDHAGPADFPPADKPRGVGWHPHRGFETVTVVFEGEVDHQDTAGNGGRIGPGDVQWMTAGSGLLHKEHHSEAFTRNGGRFHVLQLWVNLPAKSKMAAPKYQTLLARDIPTAKLAGGASLRVIAGAFRGAEGEMSGPAHTFTPVDLFELRVPAGRDVDLPLRAGFATGLYVVQGTVSVNGERAAAGELIVLDRAGDQVAIEAQDDAVLFVMSGQPIDEPVVGYGPFVMNTPQEIQKAFADFHAGKLGTIPQPVTS